MKKIKVVQIGMGHDHCDMLESPLAQKDTFELVGFAVPECEEQDYAERINKYQEKFGIRKLSVEEALSYPELDGVIIETEEKNLVKYAIMAAKRGLHIHMDKPGGFSLSEFEELVAIAKEKKLVLSLGYMYRFNPFIQDAIKKIRAGEIGEVFSIESHMSVRYGDKKRAWLSRFPGGMTFFLGCHLIDVIYQILGEPEEVIPLNCAVEKDRLDVEDFGMVVFKYKNGVSFAKSTSVEAGGFMRRQIVISGTKKTIEIRPLEHWVDEPVYLDYCPDQPRGTLRTYVREVDVASGLGGNNEFTPSEHFNRYDAMMKNFAELIGGKENPYSYDYELGLYKVILKASGVIK